MECVETGLFLPLIVPTACIVVFDFFRFLNTPEAMRNPDAFCKYFERFYCSQTFQLERCSIGLWRGCNVFLRGRILSRCDTKYHHPGYDPSRRGSVSHTFGVPGRLVSPCRMLVRAVLRSYLRVRSHFLQVRLFHTFTLIFFIHLFGNLKRNNN